MIARYENEKEMR